MSETETEMERQTDGEMSKQTGRQTDGQSDILTFERDAETQKGGQVDEQTYAIEAEAQNLCRKNSDIRQKDRHKRAEKQKD